MRSHLTKRSYHSKVLLFGEYSVIKNSSALACNYPLFDGRLSFSRGNQTPDVENYQSSRKELKSFGHYIKKYLIDHPDANFTFDFTSFEFDLEHGLFFSSSIPQGYGVGSSAAVSAAVFENYGEIINPGENKIFALRNIFKILESFFHGQSSGIDPLICFLNSSILVKSPDDIGVVDFPKFDENGKGAMFLLSTGRPHKTGPLVSLFLEKCERPSFLELCDKKLIPLTNAIIENFLGGQMEAVYKGFYSLSQFQLEHFAPMIPEDFKDHFKDGLASNKYLLKLCGAGGGGFLLGITKDFEGIKNSLEGHQMRPIFFF